MNIVDCTKAARSHPQIQTGFCSNIHWLKRSFPQLLFPHPGKILRLPVISQLMDSSLLGKIADDFTPSYNSDIIRQTPVLIAVTYIKGRCGFERDGSYTTGKKRPLADV